MTGEGPLNTNQEEEGFSIKEQRTYFKKEVEIMQLWLLNKKQLQGLLSTRMPVASSFFFLEMAWWRHEGLSHMGHSLAAPVLPTGLFPLTNVMPGMSELNRRSLPSLFMPSGSGPA